MKTIEGFPGYFVTDTGVVYSIKRNKGFKPMKLYTMTRDGYIGVRLINSAGVSVNKTVHTLVLETFVSRRPEGMQACHNDGNPTNNKLENLRWGTPRENAADKVKHRGQASPQHKLTKKDRAALKIALLNGERRSDIAKRFSLHRTTVNDYAKRLGLTK